MAGLPVPLTPDFSVANFSPPPIAGRSCTWLYFKRSVLRAHSSRALISISRDLHSRRSKSIPGQPLVPRLCQWLELSDWLGCAQALVNDLPERGGSAAGARRAALKSLTATYLTAPKRGHVWLGTHHLFSYLQPLSPSCAFRHISLFGSLFCCRVKQSTIKEDQFRVVSFSLRGLPSNT